MNEEERVEQILAAAESPWMDTCKATWGKLMNVKSHREALVILQQELEAAFRLGLAAGERRAELHPRGKDEVGK